jgi:hypothetical protein
MLGEEQTGGKERVFIVQGASNCAGPWLGRVKVITCLAGR